MDKLSLYDILGMLLPGFLFLFMLLALNQVFGISPYFEELNTNAELKELSVIFSFATIFGAIFFTSNFYLVNKTNWYNKVFGMYDHVADIYLNFGFLHSLMNETLNKKSIKQYGKPIFFYIKFVACCLVMIFTCVQLAKWYRKRLVLKMYWAYYSFLNNQEKNNK